MRKLLCPLAVVLAFLGGWFGNATFVRPSELSRWIPDRQPRDLPKRAFDRGRWLAFNADQASKVEVRKSMREAVQAKFKKGATLADVLYSLGQPDEVYAEGADLSFDAEKLMTAGGKIVLMYTVDYVDDSFVPWSAYDGMIINMGFVFDGDGGLLASPTVFQL